MAAVSNGGGLGVLGGGRGDRSWLERELGVVRTKTSRPWGIGFLAWAVERSTVDWALDQRPDALMLSFGDPSPFASRAHAAGVPLLVQVTDMGEARRALDVGADVIVAQGHEAGGHGGSRSTLPFVPAVVDLAAPTPVLAAGGIADGRGVAAALILGAAGALVGTRFQATHEALIDGQGDDTERTRVLDVARQAGWPRRYTARVLTNAFLRHWRGRENELATDTTAQRAYREASDRNDIDCASVWAGEALDLITQLDSATEIVERLSADAQQAITSINVKESSRSQ